MDNQLVFAVGSSLSGLAAELSVSLVGADGDVNPAVTPLSVTESGTVPGLYRATMAGTAGTYGALLLRDDEFVASIPTFRWSGTEFLQALTALETQAAATAAITAWPVAKPADVAVTVNGGFLTDDREAAVATLDRVAKLAKRQGLEPGVSATVLDPVPGQPGSLTTSDSAIAQTLTLNEDGSVTIENAAN